MVSKGVDCYSYLTDARYSVQFTAPKEAVQPTGLHVVNHANLQVDSSNLPWYEFTGRFQWNAQENGATVASQYNDINTVTGNLNGGTMMVMLNTPSILASDHSIAYGFYDAGPGTTGLTNQDQSYAYFTDPLASWMGDLTNASPDAANQPLHSLVLAGAHDTGMNTMNTTIAILNSPLASILLGAVAAFIPFVGLLAATIAPLAIQNLAITQKDSITTMLNLGVRYFDFRPGYLYPGLRAFSEDLYHQHAVIPGMPYAQFLEEVLVWLNTHPSELVVVSCNTQGFADDSMKPSPADLDAYLANARSATGVTEAMVGTGDAAALGQSIGALRANHQRLIFLNQINGETTKYDSYSDAYATLQPGPILAALEGMTPTGQAGATYTVLQLQGTSTSIKSVIVGAIATTSSTSSPLMSTKAYFDQSTLAWASANVATRLSNGYLTVLLNDFVENATASTAIAISKQRMGLGS